MPLPVYRLRRWLATAALLFSAVVAGMYIYANLRQRKVLKEIPHKIGYDIKQTATGFQFSKSDAGRTLFTIEAADLKEFKLNGRAELHKVSILLYGRDSSRFDQIYGDDFAYDPKSGDITAKGDVQIDLEANPAGLESPDQAAPKELKNPIHLKTRDLVFNKETGNASTAARVEFRTGQATGWAEGARYDGPANLLTLSSRIHISLTGPRVALIEAERGLVANDPRQIVLEKPRLQQADGTLQADQAIFILGSDNNVERVLARGNVTANTLLREKAHTKGRKKGSRPINSAAEAESQMRARADDAELLLTGKQHQLQTATLTGNVQVERLGFQSLQGTAGRVVLDFSIRNQLQKVHAAEGVRLAQQGVGSISNGSGAQKFELTAPVIDFFVAQGQVLDRAVTSGAAQITVSPTTQDARAAAALSGQRTVITAGTFEANFEQTSERRSRLASIHGAPDAKVTSLNPGQPDRVSTSRAIEATFSPQGGLESITQQGDVAYSDGLALEKRTQAWAEKARYTPANQMLTLTGNPRVAGAGTLTTATTIRINRSTGDAFADDDVKSTFNELKEQPNGALLASASPIHVTSRSMTAHNNPGLATYSGKARLWQDANIIEAPTIQFDRGRRFVKAQGTQAEPVSTILVQAERDSVEKRKPGIQKPEKTQSSPIVVTANQLTYADVERKAHYEDGVVARGTDFTASSRTLDIYLHPHQASGNQSLAGDFQAGPGLDHMVAEGNVLIRQKTRRAEGQKLVYTAAEDKFVLTGGPPSIFDAERGKITGVSLTFFRHDDRVLVEGEASSPVVTQTRVAP